MPDIMDPKVMEELGRVKDILQKNLEDAMLFEQNIPENNRRWRNLFIELARREFPHGGITEEINHTGIPDDGVVAFLQHEGAPISSIHDLERVILEDGFDETTNSYSFKIIPTFKDKFPNQKIIQLDYLIPNYRVQSLGEEEYQSSIQKLISQAADKMREANAINMYTSREVTRKWLLEQDMVEKVEFPDTHTMLIIPKPAPRHVEIEIDISGLVEEEMTE